MAESEKGSVDRRGFLKGVVAGAVGSAAPGSAHAHDHDHHHDHQDVPSDLTLRTKALESLLVEKGLVDPAALDALIDTMEHKVGPRNGARVVARAWVDPAYKKRLLENAPAAIADLGYSSGQGEHMIVVENGPKVHNLIVCTLVLLLPVAGSRTSACLVQVSALSLPRRHRPARHPPRVRHAGGGRRRSTRLGQHGGVALSRVTRASGRHRNDDRRAAGRAGHTGCHGRRRQSRATRVRRRRVNGVHDMGGLQGMGPVQYEKNEPVFHEPWEGRVYALSRAMRAWRKWSLDTDRHWLELMPPADYLRMSYYERWLHRLAAHVVKYGLVTKEEMESGKADAGSAKATPPLNVGNLFALVHPRHSLESRPCDSTAVQGEPARARPQHQSHRPHPPAAVRTGQDRHRRSRPRGLHLSRHERPFPG